MYVFKDMTVKKRVLLVIMSTSVFVAIAISSVSIIMSARYMKISLRKDLDSMAEMVGNNCLVSITYNIPEDAQKILSSLKSRPSITQAVIFDSDGKEFAAYRNMSEQKHNHSECLPESSDDGHDAADGCMHVIHPIMFDGHQIGVLHLFDNMHLVKVAVRNSITILIVIMAVVIAIYYFMMVGFHHLIANPIVHLSEIAKEICESGNYSLRARRETGGEIGDLVDSFNNMLDQVQSARDRIEAVVSELEDKNMELERFTYTVSHELKSPLITIKGFLGQLQKHLKTDPERIDKDMLRIETAADKMHSLLDDLLELSRIGRIVGDIREVMFNEIVDDAISRLEGGINEAGVKLSIQNDMPKVTVDTMRFSEVIQNLVENSIKFTKNRDNPKITIGFRKENGRDIFFVMDNGIGIEEEYRERVFGLFEQLEHKHGGTGIGLAIIKRIIENHGGVIWIEGGENGQGASFCFTIHEDTNKKES